LEIARRRRRARQHPALGPRPRDPRRASDPHRPGPRAALGRATKGRAAACAHLASRRPVKRKRNSRLPTIVVAILIIVVGIGFYQAVVLAKNEVNVVTSAHDLVAYAFVSDPELEFTPVPRGSVAEHDLTEAEYRERYGDNGMVLTAQVLAGQRID